MDMSDNREIRFSLEPCGVDALADTTPLLQSGFWGTLKSFSGQIPYAFKLHYLDTGRTVPLLLLQRNIIKGGSLAYVPYGPMLPAEDGMTDPFPPLPAAGRQFLIELSEALRTRLSKSCIFIRYDLPWSVESPSSYSFDVPLSKAVMDIQPSSTVVLKLTPEEETLLASMKSKTRYNIRLAARKGVVVSEAAAEELEEWYRLYEETAERDTITIHTFDYYKKLFTLAGAYDHAPEVKLLKAVIDGITAAGIIVSFHGKRATYLYGASSNEKRNYMPNYALQWEAIKKAKAAGCLYYDFFGIPDEDDPDRPMHGLYRFKVGFGGRIVHRPGCWDVPLRPAAYQGYKTAEKLRKFYYKKVKRAF